MSTTKNPQGMTRGHGFLEPYLARRRAQQANQLIPPALRTGRILDIGCGSYPYFLSHTFFEEKFAIDQLEKPDNTGKIAWFTMDLNHPTEMPFEDGYFNAVTMLAVVEHLDPGALVGIFSEIHRILRSDGRLILTTPAAWSDGLLRRMAQIGLVSAEEIHEHVYAYTLPLLGWYFGRAGFEMSKVHFGYFELGLNMWAMAER